MKTKKNVRLQLISKQNDQEIVQTMVAEQFFKGSVSYLRYLEVEPSMGRTMTTIKMDSEKLRIYRQGDVESEQTFVFATRKNGFYRTMQGTLELDTHTHFIDNHLVKGLGIITWSYDLYVSGELSGTHKITLRINKA